MLLSTPKIDEKTVNFTNSVHFLNYLIALS